MAQLVAGSIYSVLAAVLVTAVEFIILAISEIIIAEAAEGARRGDNRLRGG